MTITNDEREIIKWYCQVNKAVLEGFYEDPKMLEDTVEAMGLGEKLPGRREAEGNIAGIHQLLDKIEANPDELFNTNHSGILKEVSKFLSIPDVLAEIGMRGEALKIKVDNKIELLRHLN